MRYMRNDAEIPDLHCTTILGFARLIKGVPGGASELYLSLKELNLS